MAAGPLFLSVVLIILIWWGPGWLLGEAMGIRRILLPAVAPLVGVGALSSIGVIGNAVGLPWEIGPVALVVVIVAVLLFVLRRALVHWRPRLFSAGSAATGPPAPTPSFFGRYRLPGAWWLIAGGLVVGGVVGIVTWTAASDGFVGINQDWDIPWHANMIRLLTETHTWDPNIAGHFAYYDSNIADAPIRNYPIAFHAVLALVWPFTGAALPAFLNIYVVVMLAVQLPLSTMALTAVVTRRPIAIASAGAVSTWLAVYPYDLLFRGPLIPFFAGLLLAGPFALLACYGALKRKIFWIPGIAFGAVALVAVHPSLVFVVVAILLFWFISTAVRLRTRIFRATGYLLVAMVLALAVGLPIIAQMLGEAGRVSKVVWPADTDRIGAIKDILFLSHGSPPQPILSVVVALGCVALLLSVRTWWYVGPVLLFAAMTVYTLSSNDPKFLWLTSPFYDDQWRIFAILVMLLTPIAGLGVALTADSIRWLLVKGRARLKAGSVSVRSWQPGLITSVVAALLVVAVGIAAVPYFRANAARAGQNTKISGPTLSAGEVELLSNMDKYVPENATVLNDACDGSVWMYALGNRMPMIRHFEVLPTNRQLLVLDDLPQLPTNPAVRKAAAELGIEWVYVADGRIRAWDTPKPGLTNAGSLPFLHLVVRNGNAALYRIDWSMLPGGIKQLQDLSQTRQQLAGVPGVWDNTNPDGIAPLGRIC